MPEMYGESVINFPSGRFCIPVECKSMTGSSCSLTMTTLTGISTGTQLLFRLNTSHNTVDPTENSLVASLQWLQYPGLSCSKHSITLQFAERVHV